MSRYISYKAHITLQMVTTSSTGKSISTASVTIRALLESRNFDRASSRGDLISRAYWTCLFQEDLYHVDLDLPLTGIQSFEDEVPMPLFYPPPTSNDVELDKDPSHFKHYSQQRVADLHRQ